MLRKCGIANAGKHIRDRVVGLAAVEAERRTAKSYVRGSYVWSHYYGNFDQDNTSTTATTPTPSSARRTSPTAPAASSGTSSTGNLRGDRRHQLKVYGFYQLDWNGTVGAYAIYQSGQPWETWDVEVYRALTGSTSDTNRFAEPAGSRPDRRSLPARSELHAQLPGRRHLHVQARVDVFNVFDKQTGYNIQNKVNSSGFGDPRTYFRPRRIQLLVRLQFN